MSLTIETIDAVRVLTLDRPEVRNAFDDRLIAALTEAYRSAGQDPAVRTVLMRATGRHFSAGADLNWMRRMAGYSAAENLDDARRLAALMRAIDTCPLPTVARVQGSAFAGAVGLLACCDIVVAVPEAEFAITEVRLGLIPAVISPYLVRAMGARQARRWFLTAERFSAEQARAMNLVHVVVPADQLDAEITRLLSALGQAGPIATKEAKSLIQTVDRPLDDALIEDTACRIAAIRAGDEGRDGVAAFLEKRPPAWLAP